MKDRFKLSLFRRIYYCFSQPKKWFAAMKLSQKCANLGFGHPDFDKKFKAQSKAWDELFYIKNEN